MPTLRSGWLPINIVVMPTWLGSVVATMWGRSTCISRELVRAMLRAFDQSLDRAQCTSAILVVTPECCLPTKSAPPDFQWGPLPLLSLPPLPLSFLSPSLLLFLSLSAFSGDGPLRFEL